MPIKLSISGPESVHTESSMWQSTTPPMKPLSNDKTYYYLPFWDDKPCLYVRSYWQDHRRRLYNSNALATIADKLVGKNKYLKINVSFT